MEKIEMIIGGKLIEMGVTPNLKGFRYIVEGVKILIDDETTNFSTIYENIAKKFGVTKEGVIRSIITAFNKANKNSCLYNLYFGTLKTKSNSNCLSVMAWNIKNMIGD